MMKNRYQFINPKKHYFTGRYHGTKDPTRVQTGYVMSPVFRVRKEDDKQKKISK